MLGVGFGRVASPDVCLAGSDPPLSVLILTLVSLQLGTRDIIDRRS